MKLDGLSGRIQFDKYGRRRNYSVEVLEIVYTAGAEDMEPMVYISERTARQFCHNNTEIAASSTTALQRYLIWQEGKGIIYNRSSVTPEHKPVLTFNNQTISVTTVMVPCFASCQELKYYVKYLTSYFFQSLPFIMEAKAKNGEILTGNARYEGYCMDLIQKLSEKLKVPIVVNLVKDKKYGAVGKDGIWNGMIGELLRGEADMAIAPLTITKARERVVDFSKPFMTFGLSIMIKKPDKQEFSIFSFMSPFSSEIWRYLALSYIGISLVIFAVCRFSPDEWRMEELGAGGHELTNDFSFSNCLWFTLAAFMQQGTDIVPRYETFFYTLQIVTFHLDNKHSEYYHQN